MTFSGINPTGLQSLGNSIEFQANSISSAASTAMAPLERHDKGAVADRIGTRLSSVARSLRTASGDFGWRIEAVLAQDNTYGPGGSPWDLPVSKLELAIGLPVGVDVRSVGVTRNEVRELSEKTPAEVAAYFATQSRDEISLIVATHPNLINDLDGAPPWARYASSDLLISRHMSTLRDEADYVRELLEEGYGDLVVAGLLGHLEDVEAEADELALWLREDRQILLFDPRGDGRVAEVFGDLEEASDIGVVVPGITNDRSNFSDGDGGFRATARNVHERSQELNVDGVATIAWLGYNTPDHVGALVRTAANEGHGDLIDFVAGMDALDGNRHITVIGHSYGSLVTGMAAGEGLAANEVVFVGSPGTSLGHADEAKLKPGGVVWAGIAHGDPIGIGANPFGKLTPWSQIADGFEQLYEWADGEPAIKQLYHGVNPAHEDFGALEFHTDGATGHSQYFDHDTVSLDNLLYIIAGMDGAVSIEIPEVIEMAPGPIGEPWEPWPVEEGELA
ncbi:MAG: hypothetical protein HKN91_06585 [Acidimicrobiia bacterium]|nr:hypothetical protein [Acidimicrobiia bacterium]